MKNTSFIRIFALICALLSFAVLLAACSGGGGGTAEPTVTSETPETEAPSRDIVIFSGGETKFVIVRPKNAEDTKTYTAFRKDLREASGTNIDLDIDDFYRTHEYDPAKPEILCGAVDYPEARSSDDGLGFSDYRVGIVGEKIVISAKTDAALLAGCNAFSAYVAQNIKDGELTLKSDFELTGEIEIKGFSILSESIPSPEGFSSAVFSHPGDGYQQATLSGTDAESFEGYCTVLEQEGFALYAENEMAENTFATYTKGEVSVHFYYTPHNSEMRIIASKGELLPWKETESYTKVCEPTVTLMGLEKSGSEGGMGMIIGLEDGSFIVVDGGNNKRAEAEDLANTMKKLAPDLKNIRIRAWVITHGHGDHVGALLKFSETYVRSGNFKIEKFIYNFCDSESQRKHGGVSYTNARNAMKFWKDAVHYKALTGEVYRFPGCELEIFYCMSDFIPQIIGEEKGIPDIDKESIDGNIETMVSRATLCGQSLLITGDTSKVCVDEMCDRYGSYLKSDILQVPHHGHNSNRYRARNGTVEFYRLIDPAVALWPSDVDGYTSRTQWDHRPGTNFEANYILVFELNVKKTIVAGKTTTTITLPYNP